MLSDDPIVAVISPALPQLLSSAESKEVVEVSRLVNQLVLKFKGRIAVPVSTKLALTLTLTPTLTLPLTRTLTRTRTRTLTVALTLTLGLHHARPPHRRHLRAHRAARRPDLGREGSPYPDPSP